MRGILAAVATPPGWSTFRLDAVVERRKVTGHSDLEPLSVFTDLGVVPRASQEWGYKALGDSLDSYLLVEPGDIVFNKLRTWQGAIGISQFRGIVSPAYYVCRPTGRTSGRFLHYLLRSTPWVQELKRVSKWMPPNQNDIAWDDLKRIDVLLPDGAEQRAITAFLEEETDRIDSLIAKKLRVCALLDERSFALLSHLIAPSGSAFTRLGRFASIQTGLTVDGARPMGEDVVTRPYLRVANVQHGGLALDVVTEISVPRPLAERTTLRSGDVLMTEGGDLDKLGRGTVWRDEIPGCLHQNHVFAVRTDPVQLDAEYLALLTQTAHGRAYFERTGSRITNLASTSSAKVLDFPIPAIPLERQRALVREASNATAAGARIRDRLTRQIELLHEHRQALITSAVTGQLDIAKAAA